MNDQEHLQALQILQVTSAAASTLAERCTQRERHLLCTLLSTIMLSRPTFERLAIAFREGAEGDEFDIEIVRTMLRARIDLETALCRIDDDGLDEFAADVDAELKPFEDAVFMVNHDTYDFKRCYEECFIDPDTWWGVLVRHEEMEQSVNLSLWKMREHIMLDAITSTGASAETASRCLILAARHLDKLRWKQIRVTEQDPGFPASSEVLKLAMRLVRVAEEKLKRFEDRLQYAY